MRAFRVVNIPAGQGRQLAEMIPSTMPTNAFSIGFSDDEN